ncbi:GumC family protein [Vibrio sp. VB16]|uniref:GumC family protein n=1 Tax=Vibrio sp. VB16 TaxID=2785746 RepID=UPI00189EAD2B|nr:chain-length determining protein [Vibrio sp. VB16]UGA57736.1 chain-length determining protein [Vibrio sp. VB16]
MIELKIRLLILLQAAWRRRYILLMPVLIMPFAGYIVSKLAPAQYHSHTSMLIQETAKMNPFLEDIAVSTGFKDRINALSTLLKSRHILQSVALDLGLIDVAMSTKESEKVIRSLSERISVHLLGKEFVQIKLTAAAPQGMKALLESISNHFIDQVLAPERSSIKDSAEFLTFHINKRLEELNNAEQALADFQNINPNVSPERQNEKLSRLAALKQTLSEKKATLAGVEKSLGSLDQQLSRTNPVVGKIEEQIIEARSQLTLLRANYTENHSAVQAKNRELSRLESERETMVNVNSSNLSSEKLWDIASSIQLSQLGNMQPLLITQLQSLQLIRSQYESLQEESQSLKQMIFVLDKETNQFGDQSKILFNLQRSVTNKRRLYDELVERFEMAQLTGSLGNFEQNKRVKIIDLPYTPSQPSNFPSWVYVLSGLFAGIALGAGMATLLELFDTTIRRQDELISITGVPVLSSIPNVSC